MGVGIFLAPLPRTNLFLTNVLLPFYKYSQCDTMNTEVQNK